MRTRLRERLSYANVMSTIAVVLAVAGGTTAIAGPGKAPKNSVNSKSIKDGSVTAKDLAKIRVVSAPAFARCPGKTKLIGGGAGGAAAESRPHDTLKNTWSAVPGQAYAICLSAKPGK